MRERAIKRVREGSECGREGARAGGQKALDSRRTGNFDFSAVLLVARHRNVGEHLAEATLRPFRLVFLLPENTWNINKLGLEFFVT